MRLRNITKVVIARYIYVCFVQTKFRNLFVDRRQFAQSVILIFDKNWLFITETFQEKDSIRGLELKTMRISFFSEHNVGIAFVPTNQT